MSGTATRVLARRTDDAKGAWVSQWRRERNKDAEQSRSGARGREGRHNDKRSPQERERRSGLCRDEAGLESDSSRSL